MQGAAAAVAAVAVDGEIRQIGDSTLPRLTDLRKQVVMHEP
jgi:hypothetical protein